MKNRQYGANEVMDVVFLDDNLVPKLALNWCKVTDLESSAESVNATGGRGNAVFATWDYNTTANLNITHATISPQMLEVLTGMAKKTGKDGAIRYVERGVKATDEEGVAALKLKYNATSILSITDEELDEGIDFASLPTIDTDDPHIVTHNALEIGKTYTVVYNAYSTQGQLFTINADQFPGYYKVVATFLTRDTDGKDVPNVLYMGKGRINADFTFELTSDGDPATFEIPVSIEQDDNKDLYKWFIVA